MFLKKLCKRNPDFIHTVFFLHQKGLLPVNSYVLDLDTIGRNASLMVAEGNRLGLKVFPMTKQIGRNPNALDTLASKGLDAYVAVDMNCARPIHARGYHIGHLGHLVQVPKHEAKIAACMHPYYWTVFNKTKAREAAAAADMFGYKQALMARIFATGDTFYMGHEGGFPAKDILKIADFLDELSGSVFAGITSFPALLFNQDTQTVEPTPNMATLGKAAEILVKTGRSNIEINAPGTTSTRMMEILADIGATQVEPGHGLTGTTPLHAVEDLPELPAILYLSEISHIHLGKPYCFGGGLYIDPVFPDYDVQALIGKEGETAKSLSVKIPPANAIDYYGIITAEGNQNVEIGDTVVFGFRPQAFVTRAFVTSVSGISDGKPKVEGVFTSSGRKTNWPDW